ncbi:DUF397 domain-containing protein [Streptomyces sp. GESEQ-4]|uniref:DUF397 domain-containing protein n=1 Tax=Streptomyces sp. GESEQ-4 TaxID=2812655 RepID=UPI001B31D952|nr:DUF397 domain-containing protein [Streptomyces sp. GESEQ-4]
MRNTPDYDLSTAIWHKSSHSGGDGSDCLEVTHDLPALVPVRDSKNPQAPNLVFRASAWSVFVNAVQRGQELT